MVGGFRYAASSKVVGSLLLGLYNVKGWLDYVGFTSSIAAADRPELTKKLKRLIEPPGFTGNAPGGPSRWSRGKENSSQPLKPTLVVGVRFDHVSSRRLRHGPKLLRWRPGQGAQTVHSGSTRSKAIGFIATA